MRFRKKPVVIVAVQFTGENHIEICDFLGKQEHDHTFPGSIAYYPEKTFITIKTLEGEMIAYPGWWVIRGVQGEFYPCKPDIFEATYEEVEE